MKINENKYRKCGAYVLGYKQNMEHSDCNKYRVMIPTI